jgi:hypothetical protein
LTHSIASAIDLTCHSQKPAISSLVSLNGPSITVRFPPENRTRLPFELAWSPSVVRGARYRHLLSTNLGSERKRLIS